MLLRPAVRRLAGSLSQARQLPPLSAPSPTRIAVPCLLRRLVLSPTRLLSTVVDPEPLDAAEEASTGGELPRAEHAVISAFDLFSIGVGPSSSHTVGPMRAGKIFVSDLEDLGILEKVRKIKIGLYGSLAATGKGHMTPEAVMMGLEGSDPESIEPATIPTRYASILSTSRLSLNGTHTIPYSHDKDMRWDMRPLPAHPNGMRFSVFDAEGTLLATNEFYSVGGGFVVNEQTQVDENLYYRGIHKSTVDHARLDQTHGLASATDSALPSPSSSGADGPLPPTATASAGAEVVASASDAGGAQGAPRFLFRDAAGLLKMTQKHNLTIAQVVWENERHRLSDQEIEAELHNLWRVMDSSIHAGVSSTEEVLPGRLQVRRRAPHLYRRLFKGFYPSLSPSSSPSALPPSASPSLPSPPTSSSSAADPSAHPLRRAPAPRAPLVVGSFDHPLPPSPKTRASLPGIDWLSAYAIAVNETNASGGRVVTAPTNGAAGVIPAVLKYLLEFISDDPDRDIKTFLLTAAAIGMLYKRGATISAAEGGCMAEVGVASSMAAGAFTACLGGTPSQVLQAAEIGIEHSLGLTCDPHDGLVQVPCIERNSLGAVKAVTAAQLALAGSTTGAGGVVSLDDAIEAMRLTARDMHQNYKETSLSGLATTVKIPLSSPAC
ncbi:hypothetical protein JCM10207_008963 [Rhodosporidiobolus poonsookiae]